MITVPALIWSGVAGALAGAVMAMVTTLLNNRSQNSRQERQLDHDADQRTRQLDHDAQQREEQFEHDSEQRRIDREMSLRREVYLGAAAAAGKMQEFIGYYAKPDVSESEKLALLQGSTASLNKVHVIGSNQTIEKFGDTQFSFLKCNLRLGALRIDIIKRTTERDRLERALRLLEEKREALLKRVHQFRRDAAPEVIEELRASISNIEKDYQEGSEALDDAHDKLFSRQIDLVRESVKSNIELALAFSKAALAVREELGIGLNIESYQTFLELHQARLGDAFEDFLRCTSEENAGESEQAQSLGSRPDA